MVDGAEEFCKHNVHESHHCLGCLRELREENASLKKRVEELSQYKDGLDIHFEELCEVLPVKQKPVSDKELVVEAIERIKELQSQLQEAKAFISFIANDTLMDYPTRDKAKTLLVKWMEGKK